MVAREGVIRDQVRLGSKLATSCAAAMRRFRRTWRRQAGAVRATQPLSVFCPCSVRRTPEISVKAVYVPRRDFWYLVCWVALNLGRNCPHNPTIGLGRAEPSSFTGDPKLHTISVSAPTRSA